jgi:2-hydroxychromene-2-carboxylate isomerase
MQPDDAIEFWFAIGSTYTYLTVARVHQVAAATGVRFVWRPFSVRTIMQEMNNIPFHTKPIKMAYMWRDIERRAGKYGLPIKVPAPYPLRDFDLANRVAVLAAMEGWCEEYVCETYRRWFVEEQEAGSDPNLSDSLRAIGQEPSRVISLCQSDSVRRAYEAATDEARRLHIFGAPTFVTHGEVFWGDDRLEDALAWHAKGKLG